MSLSATHHGLNPSGNHLMPRAVNSPLVQTGPHRHHSPGNQSLCFYAGRAGVRLLKSYRADRAQFAAALNVAMIALTTSGHVVGGIPRCRGRMVSNVAVENVEWGRKRHSECLPLSVWCF